MKKLFLLTLLFVVAMAHSTRAGLTVVGSLARHTTIKPGESFEGVILVKNPDPRPAEARVFQTDYLCDAEGHNTYADPGSSARSNAGWITVTPTRVKMAPGETVPVRYKGRAPSDPKLRGTYWSLIMIEPSATPGSAAEEKASGIL